MKFNKAFALLNGKKIIKYVIDSLENYFDETLIISNEPSLYEEFRLPIHKDLFPHFGPISGIHAGLTLATNEVIVVCACDMPFINADVLTYLASKIDDYDCAVPLVNNRLQPLVATYHRKCLPLFEHALFVNDLKLTELVEHRLNSLIIDDSNLRNFGVLERIFYNVNNMETLLLAEKMVREA